MLPSGAGYRNDAAIMEFTAKHVSIEDDGYCTVMAFADGSPAPHSFLILQITNEPDEQDEALQLAGVHLQLCNDQWSGYDLVDAIELGADTLVLRVKAPAVQHLGLPEWVSITIRPDSGERDALTTTLPRFASRICAPSNGS
jgi:Immunity protein 10